jgi:hypothetical protein
MNLSNKLLFILPAASFVIAAAVGSGACSSSSSGTLAVSAVPTNDTFPDDVVIGDTCNGTVYVSGTTGYAFCDGGKWAYTVTDPTTDGYGPYTPADAGDDSGDDATSDAGDDSGDDATSDAGDDSGDDATDDSGDDATQGDDSGDDATQGDDSGDDTGTQGDDSGTKSDDSGS